MTLVVTHANGFLGCFTKEPDGTMRQRALIDTGDTPPTPEALALVGDGLADQWGWIANALPAARNGKAKALPAADGVHVKGDTTKAAAKRARNRTHLISDGGHVRHPDDPPPAERPALILAYVQKNPHRTMSEIVAGLGMEANNARVSRWHHTFKRMDESKMIAKRRREGSGKGRVWEWFAL